MVVIKKIRLRHKKDLKQIKQTFNKEFYEIVGEIDQTRKEQQEFFNKWSDEKLANLRKL